MSSASRQNEWDVVAPGLLRRLQLENKMLSRQGMTVLERGALLGSVAQENDVEPSEHSLNINDERYAYDEPLVEP